jgi:hypothetical protein
VTAPAVKEAFMTRPDARPATSNLPARASILACAALVLAACSATGISLPTQTPATEVAPSASGSDAAPSPTGGPSPDASGVGLPIASGDPEDGASGLEGVLPDQIGGAPATKGSMVATAFLASGLSTPDLEGILARLGVRPSEIRVAFAYTANGPSGTVVFGFRVPGATELELRQALAAGREQEIRGSTTGSHALGGKPTVTIADDPLPGGRSVYRYASGSFVFFIVAGHESTAGEILAGLP